MKTMNLFVASALCKRRAKCDVDEPDCIGKSGHYFRPKSTIFYSLFLMLLMLVGGQAALAQDAAISGLNTRTIESNWDASNSFGFGNQGKKLYYDNTLSDFNSLGLYANGNNPVSYSSSGFRFPVNSTQSAAFLVFFSRGKGVAIAETVQNDEVVLFEGTWTAGAGDYPALEGSVPRNAFADGDEIHFVVSSGTPYVQALFNDWGQASGDRLASSNVQNGEIVLTVTQSHIKKNSCRVHIQNNNGTVTKVYIKKKNIGERYLTIQESGGDWTNREFINSGINFHKKVYTDDGVRNVFIGATNNMGITAVRWYPQPTITTHVADGYNKDAMPQTYPGNVITFVASAPIVFLDDSNNETSTVTVYSGTVPLSATLSDDHKTITITGEATNLPSGIYTFSAKVALRYSDNNGSWILPTNEQSDGRTVLGTVTVARVSDVQFKNDLRFDQVSGTATMVSNFMVPTSTGQNKRFLIMANGSGKNVQYYTNSYEVNAANFETYNDPYYLYIGGGGDQTQRCIKVHPIENGKLYVYAKVGNGQTLILNDGTGGTQSKTGDGTEHEYVFDVVSGKTYSLYTGSNGWYIYFIGSTASLAEFPVPKDLTVTATPSATTISVGDPGSVTAGVSNADNSSDYTLSYSSSNPDVVSVDGSGTLTTVSAGTATITLTATINSSKYERYKVRTYTGTCNVTVVAGQVLNPVPGAYIWDKDHHQFGEAGVKVFNQASEIVGTDACLEVHTASSTRYISVDSEGALDFMDPADCGVKFIAPAPGRVTVTAMQTSLQYGSNFSITGLSSLNTVPNPKIEKTTFVTTGNVDGKNTEVIINMGGGSGNKNSKIYKIEYEPFLLQSLTVGGRTLNVEKNQYDVTVQVLYEDNKDLGNLTFSANGIEGTTFTYDNQSLSNASDMEGQEQVRTVTANLNGITVTYTVRIQLVSLVTLPGSYKWNKGLSVTPNFGEYKTYNDTNLPNIAGQDFHLQLQPSASDRGIIVDANGLTFPKPAGTYAKFKVPGAGLIRVKANVAMEGNYAFFDINGQAHGFPYKDYENSKVYMYEYGGTAEIPVQIRFTGGSSSRYVEMLEYIQVPKLQDYGTNDDGSINSSLVGVTKSDFIHNDASHWSSAGVSGDGTISKTANCADNYSRIIADGTSQIQLVSDGYKFVQGSDFWNLLGYLEIAAHSPGKLEVWAKPANSDSRLKVSGGEIPKDRDIEITKGKDGGTNGNPTYTMEFINTDATRNVFIGGTAGVIITGIKWTPSVVKNTDAKLVPVPTNQITSWNKWNNYGGFTIKADGENSTDIQANILNPGFAAIAAQSGIHDGFPQTNPNTLMIYGEDIGNDNSRTNFSKNGILTLGATPRNQAYAAGAQGQNADDWNDDHFIEFKVTTPGVLKLTGAGNGPNGRVLRAGLDLTTDKLIMVTEGNLHYDHNNNQEHTGDIERHQHDSNHTFYCYFDGTGTENGEAVSIYVFGRGGTNYDEITWMPNRTIETAEGVKAATEGGWGGELNPEGALKICDAAANIKNYDGSLVIPKRLYINQYDAAYKDNVYGSWRDYGTNNHKGQLTSFEYSAGKFSNYYNMYANVNTKVSESVTRHVTLKNMTPVWKTSQDGRGGYREAKVVTVIKEDLRNGFSNSVEKYPDDMERLVSYPFRLQPLAKTIKSSESAASGMTDEEKRATGAKSKRTSDPKGQSNHPGFGIVYVIAGTEEGNRWDDRRFEIAGPPTGLDIIPERASKKVRNGNFDYTVYPVTAVANKKFTLTVNPYLTYVDLNVGGNDGTDVRIKVDNPTVTWYESNAAGIPLDAADRKLRLIDDAHPESGDAPVTCNGNATTEYHEDDIYKSVLDLSTLTVKPLSAGKTYVTAAIWGVAEEGSPVKSYRYKELTKTFEIDIKPNGLYLERVLPVETQNVSVAEPIVFRAFGAIESEDDGVYVTVHSKDKIKSKTTSDSYKNLSTDDTDLPLYLGNRQGMVVEVPLRVKVIGTDIFFVYDVVKYLQDNDIDQHMNYGAWQSAKFNKEKDGDYTFGNIYKYIGGDFSTFNQWRSDKAEIYKEEDANKNRHNIYDFEFNTESYELGSELETYLYNISQRTNDNLIADVSNNRMLNDHFLESENITRYDAAQPWFCNWRSYITMSGISNSAASTDAATSGRILTWQTGGSASITIEPYDNVCQYAVPTDDDNTTEQRNKRQRRGMIKQIEVNFLPTYNAASADDNTGTVKFYKKERYDSYEGATPAATFQINKETNYTAIWTLDEDGLVDMPTIANLTRYAKIEFVPTSGHSTLKIDQIKVTYYSAESNDRILMRHFDNYFESNPGNDNDWGKKVLGGIEMETTASLTEDGYDPAETEKNIKLMFKDDNKRHFMLRERWSRASADGATDYDEEKMNTVTATYRGEKMVRKKNAREGRTTLVMRDDKTEPCRMYFFTKNNVAEISRIEFVCEDDDQIVEDAGDDSSVETADIEGTQTATVTWPFNAADMPRTGDVSMDGLVATSTFDLGSHLAFDGSKKINSIPMTLLKTTEYSAGCDNSAYIKFVIKPKGGLKFAPTNISFKASSVGTDGGNMDVVVKQGENSIDVLSNVHPAKHSSDAKYTAYNSAISGLEQDDKPVEVCIYVYNLDTSKQLAINNLQVECAFTKADDSGTSSGSRSTEILNAAEGNKLTPRNLYCTSDPRYNPTSANNYVGYPFEVITGLTMQDGTKVHKLVYRPESPVNFAFISGDPNQEGFFFVRQIIVHYDKDARKDAYTLKNPNVNKGEFYSDHITNVGLDTEGLQLSIPAVNDVEAYSIKRTATRTNLSSEVVLSESRSIVNSDAVQGSYEMPVLHDLDDSKFTNYLHRKFYTIRVLDTNRMITRQLGFRTLEQTKPQISRKYSSAELDGTNVENTDGWVKNIDLYAEVPIKTLGTNDIKITPVKRDKNDHDKGQQLIIWTDDGSAPTVEFGPDGRDVVAIHGYVSVGDENGDLVLSSSNYFGDGYSGKKSIVLKAIAMSLDLASGSTVRNVGLWSTNDIDISDSKTSKHALLQKIKEVGGTHGETTSITRANYVYVQDGIAHYVTARRNSNNSSLSVLLDKTETLKLNGNVMTYTLDDLYNMREGHALEADDKFHSGYYTSIVKNKTVNSVVTPVEMVKMIYGGYELYAPNKYAENGALISDEDDFMPTYEGETYKDDRFRRDILKNEYWRVAQNDLTPYRGLPGIIGGDAYLVSNVEPLNEKAKYDNDEINHNDESIDGLGAYNIRRVFVGQFDYARHISTEVTKTQHDRLWNLPCYGDYFQYEPKANGKLTVYVKQQGVMEQKENGTLDDKLIRFRPVFILDEAGKTPDGIKATTSSKVSGDWMTMTHTQNVASKYLSESAQETLYDMCDKWISDNTSDESKLPQIEYGDRAYKEQGVIAMYGTKANAVTATKNGDKTYTYSDDFESDRESLLGARDGGEANGFMLVSEGYVKYEFDVRAGKTYFVFAANGNLGLCSYSFDENTDVTLKGTSSSNGGTFVIGDNDTNDTNMKELLSNNGKTVDVVLNRTFTDGKWSSLVLPFSVSKKQLREAFGDGVKVAHFDRLEDNYLVIMRHIHQMVVAGTPIFIKPTKSVQSVNFDNVTVEDAGEEYQYKAAPSFLIGKDKVNNRAGLSDAYQCLGTYTKATAGNNSWYMTGNGNFAERVYGDYNIKGTRAWINFNEDNGPAIMSSNMRIACSAIIAESEENGETGGIATGVEDFMINDAAVSDGNVYNLKGQIVRKGVNLENLPQGVYIINGVKYVVK